MEDENEEMLVSSFLPGQICNVSKYTRPLVWEFQEPKLSMAPSGLVIDWLFFLKQVMESIVGRLAQSKADTVLLAYRLDRMEPERVRRKVHSDSNIMTGITSASQEGSLESIADLLRATSGQAAFSGKFGDCCDDDEDDLVSQVDFHQVWERFHSRWLAQAGRNILISALG